VLIDLTEVSFLSSIGIRLLLINAKSVQRGGGKLVLLGAQPSVLEVLEVAGVMKLFPVHDTREGAERELNAAS
jgi:anti-anti-sigma factor